jgi:hypothetical protein
MIVVDCKYFDCGDFYNTHAVKNPSPCVGDNSTLNIVYFHFVSKIVPTMPSKKYMCVCVCRHLNLFIANSGEETGT